MDWKEMLGKDFGTKLEDAMTEMAKGLGIAAKHLYTVLVKQQIANGLTTTIGCLIGIVILAIVVWKLGKLVIREDFSEALAFIIPIALVVGGILLYNMLEGVKHLINPEYYAIKDIMNFIHGNDGGN